MGLHAQVTQHTHGADVPVQPEDGVYVDGLWLEGGRWDAAGACLAAPQPGVLYAPLPVVHFRPQADGPPPAGHYQCPLYKTGVRAGVLSTTGQSTNFVLCVGLPMAPGASEDAWVLQGTALLCMLND